MRVPSGAAGLDLDAVLGDLARCGVQSLLVEGGGKTHASFLDAGRADRLALFYAPSLLGAQGAVPIVDRATVATPAAGWKLKRARQLALGGDVAILGELVAPSAEGGGG